MTDKDTILETVRTLSLGRSLEFPRLLEQHGIEPNDQPAYIKRANAMSEAMLQMCNHYCKQTGEDNRILFCAVAMGMGMDASLHGLISKSESEQIIKDDHQTMMGRTTAH